MKIKGFNMIELITVLSIVAILTALAVPSYVSYITHERQVAAKTELVRLASLMEAFYTENNTYQGATLAKFRMPEYIAQNNYQLIINQASQSNYEVLAKPINNQAKKDRCGVFTINSQGARRSEGQMQECWYI